jgi:hypothetical protein
VPLTRLARGRSSDGCPHDRRSAGVEYAVGGTVSSPAADDNVEKVASHCVQAFTGVHADNEIFHPPLCGKLRNATA